MKRKQIAGLFGGFLVVAGAIYSVSYQFNHPALTETQLFMKLWGVYLGILVGILLLGVMLRDTR